MSRNATNMYDVDRHIAEIHDQVETQTDDLQLIRRLLNGQGRLRILEPFCGTGRLLIPLAQDGHTCVGLDQAKGMLEYAEAKLAQLPGAVRRNIALHEADVTTTPWPTGFDVVILGGNCFYELATPEEQEGCIAAATAALHPGGCVYVDNNHMEGELAEEWRQTGVNIGRFPTGRCLDGTEIMGETETTWWDAPRRLVRFRRRLTVINPDGSTCEREWEQQKHPVSEGEVRGWLLQHGFVIEHCYGDRQGNPYTSTSNRAIFWARRTM